MGNISEELTSKLLNPQSRFTVGALLGRGAYGLCYLCKDLSNRLKPKVVIKKVPFSSENLPESDRKAISHEARLLKLLRHPNIIRLYSSFEKDGQLCIVMEYLDGVGDFGISRELNTKNEASTIIGTPNYLSPEICEGRPYGAKSDIWSAGCVLYELVELKKAYQGDSFPSIVLRITRGKHGPISPTVPEELQKLILSLLEIDEENRPTTKEILMVPAVLKKWMEIHVNLGRIKPDILQCLKETYA